MNTEKVINELSLKYPGKKIIKINEENPTEIICEVDPSSEHPEKSIAIAVINRSEPHYHKKSTEIYRIIKGELNLIVDNKEYNLKENDVYTIHPGEIHYAIGSETWVEVISEPGWTLEDHIIKEL